MVGNWSTAQLVATDDAAESTESSLIFLSCHQLRLLSLMQQQKTTRSLTGFPLTQHFNINAVNTNQLCLLYRHYTESICNWGPKCSVYLWVWMQLLNSKISMKQSQKKASVGENLRCPCCSDKRCFPHRRISMVSSFLATSEDSAPYTVCYRNTGCHTTLSCVRPNARTWRLKSSGHIRSVAFHMSTT